MVNIGFTEWDKQRTEYGRVLQCTEEIGYWADQIEKCTILIKEVPDFELRMEAEIKRAIKQLQSALTAIEEKRNASGRSSQQG